MKLFQTLELINTYKRQEYLLSNIISGQKPHAFSGINIKHEPVNDRLSAKNLRDSLKKVRFKLAKLNDAITLANLKNTIKFENDELTLRRAIELRKEIKNNISDLENLIPKNSYSELSYNSGVETPIKEDPKLDVEDLINEYNNETERFQKLCELIRETSLTIDVNYRDEGQFKLI